MNTKRAFTAPKDSERCIGTVTLRDGSKAQCMHKAARNTVLQMCRQHHTIEMRAVKA